jgi:poly [ADP-ribose] polymerase
MSKTKAKQNNEKITTRSSRSKATKASPEKPKDKPNKKKAKNNNLPKKDEVEKIVQKSKTSRQKKDKVKSVKPIVSDKTSNKKDKTKTQDKTKDKKPILKNPKKAPKKNPNKEEKKDDEMDIEEDKQTIVVEKNGAVVDAYVPDSRLYFVTKDRDGSFGYKNLTATLNQCNLKNNNNKFYILQVLTNESNNQLYLFRRWGRCGYNGSKDLIVKFINLALR